jgi:hypothetical protein
MKLSSSTYARSTKDFSKKSGHVAPPSSTVSPTSVMSTQPTSNTSKASASRSVKPMPKNPYVTTTKKSSTVSTTTSSSVPTLTTSSSSSTTSPQVIDLTDDEVVHIATRYVTPNVVYSGAEFARKKQKILAANAARKDSVASAARKVSAIHLPRSIGGPPRGDMLPVSIKRLGVTGPRQTNLMQLEFVAGRECKTKYAAASSSGVADYDADTIDCEGTKDNDDDTLFSTRSEVDYKTPEKDVAFSGGLSKYKTPEDEKYPELKKVVTEEQEDDARIDQGIETGVKPTPLSLLRITDQQEADYRKALADGDVEDEERRRVESFPVWDPRGWYEDNPEDMPPSYCTFCRCPPTKCHNQLFGQYCQLHVVHALYNCNHEYDLLTLDKAEDIFTDRYNEVLQFTIFQENGTLDVKAGGYELPFCVRDTSLAQSLDYVRFYVYHFTMHRSIVVGRAQPQNGMNHIFETI